jgi:hypothetical protein
LEIINPTLATPDVRRQIDHPEEIQPSAHMMAEKQLPWLKINAGLPRYPKWPPGDEGLDQNL